MVHTENGCTNKQIKLATIVIHIKYDFLSFIRLLPLVTRARATTFWKNISTSTHLFVSFHIYKSM